MTTFSNKVLYTKGHLNHHSIILHSTQTEETFKFKEPVKNVIAIEAVQGIILTTGTSPNYWCKVRCPLLEKRLEGKMGTEYDTPLALINANVPLALSHSTRFFSKPKDSIQELTLSLEDLSGNPFSLKDSWILELDITSVIVGTHADWKNIPSTKDVKDNPNQKFDKVHDHMEENFETPWVRSRTDKKNKKKKNNDVKNINTVSGIRDNTTINNSTLNTSNILKSSVGLLGVGTALAMGLKFK
tara:strand:- start:6260 stop:6988 length:729 start_codon:yes stop_codon:yes gene_type:complete